MREVLLRRLPELHRLRELLYVRTPQLRVYVSLIWDSVVVGGGVVGLACARALSAGGRTVLLIERHARFGEETSSRNSGVLHAGIYYPPGSLKAELCVRGNRSLYEYCAAHHVPHSAVGKFLVATNADEEAQLDALHARAHANGAVEVVRCTLDELRRSEPNVRATAALWSPRTGIVDVAALMRSLQSDSQAQLAPRNLLVAVRFDGTSYQLTLRDAAGREETVIASRVVNAAGLDADEVAALAGFDVDACGYRQHFVKGCYFRLRKTSLFHHLIYPVPPPDHAGVGVHVTLGIDGSVRLGPDTQEIDRTRDYRVDENRRDAFFAAARGYLVGIEPDDLEPDQAGIRPKVRGGDFIVREESAAGRPGWINLLGIESPGLTSCLELAARVAALP